MNCKISHLDGIIPTKILDEKYFSNMLLKP